RRGRCRCHSCGNCLPDRAAGRLDPPARDAPRCDRRSMGRAHIGVVDGVAAAGLEFRGSAARRRERRLLGSEGARKARSVDASTRVRADRRAEEHPDRLRQRLLCRGHRFCADLAHLVDGRFRSLWRIRDVPCIRISRAGRGRDTRCDTCAVRSRSPDGGRAMNVAVAVYDVKQDAFAPASEAGPAPKRVVVGFGFWVFLLSDIVMFSALFAAYAVLVHATAGGPAGPQLFSQVGVAIETACLLASSYTCGMMSLAVSAQRRRDTHLFALITFVLGAAFVGLEVREFADMIARGAAPQRSAFLSAYFTL